MDQLICASLSYTHDLYEVGMLKVKHAAYRLQYLLLAQPVAPVAQRYLVTL